MKTVKLFKFFVIALTLSFFLVACSSTKTETPSENFQVANEEPLAEQPKAEPEKMFLDDFTLTTLDGTETSLYAYEGKTILLNFWASWCTYCRQGMPHLDSFALENDDVVVLAVNAGEDKATIRKYLEDSGYEFDVFVDEKSALAAKFGVAGLPTTLFIGPDFEFYTIAPGFMDRDDLNYVIGLVRDYQTREN